MTARRRRDATHLACRAHDESLALLVCRFTIRSVSAQRVTTHAMPGSRLLRKILARREAAATRLQLTWRARPARRDFLTMRAAALKVQVAWLARRRARFAAASRLKRPPLWLGMSSAARKQACKAAITGNVAMLEIDRIGICVHCSGICVYCPASFDQTRPPRCAHTISVYIDDRGFSGENGFTARCPHCGIDAVLPFRALPRNPIERRVLLRWCYNDRFLMGQTVWVTTHLEERMRDRNFTAEQVNASRTAAAAALSRHCLLYTSPSPRDS